MHREVVHPSSAVSMKAVHAKDTQIGAPIVQPPMSRAAKKRHVGWGAADFYSID